MPKAGRRTSASTVGSNQSVGALVDAIAVRLADVPEVVDPRREANDVLAAVLDVPRHWPKLHENKWAEAQTWQRAMAAANKRARGAPLAYAAGRANFRHLTLDVDECVLIPRPETEVLVDLVLENCASGGTVVDVGTGSGAIAISLATEGKFDRVIATDVSSDALAIACANAQKFCDERIQFVHGSLLSPLPADGGTQLSLRAVVSNPPYVSFSEIVSLPPSVRNWEPMIALLSAQDGLATTRRLVRQAAALLEPGGLLALEVDVRRASLVAEVVSSDARYEEVSVRLDLAGRERFVMARRAGGTHA